MENFKYANMSKHYLKQEKIELINEYFYIMANSTMDESSKKELLDAIEQDIIKIEQILGE
jgi:hypothetical protein